MGRKSRLKQERQQSRKWADAKIADWNRLASTPGASLENGGIFDPEERLLEFLKECSARGGRNLFSYACTKIVNTAEGRPMEIFRQTLLNVMKEAVNDIEENFEDMEPEPGEDVNEDMEEELEAWRNKREMEEKRLAGLLGIKGN